MMLTNLFPAIAMLLLGWLLGIVSPAIIEAIRWRRKRDMIARGIRSELITTKDACVSGTFVIEMKLRGLTRELVTWYGQNHSTSHSMSLNADIQELVLRLSQTSEEDFRKYSEATKPKPGASLNLKEILMPYTQSKLGELELFSEEIRRLILEILARIRIFNQAVESRRFFFKMTFDKLDAVNHQSVCKQELAEIDSAGQQAKIIVGSIVRAIEQLDSR